MSSNITAKRLDNVVYLLGAGFSAPLEIPVMSNFREKSEDMFAIAPDQYGNFKEVFKTIGKMSEGKNYFDSNLFNIEEILSILEMREELSNSRETKRSLFRKYIVDVVKYYTPRLEFKDYLEPLTSPFGEGYLNNCYGFFVGSLLNLGVSDNGQRQFFTTTWMEADRLARYSVITLNYDMVLENCLSYLIEHFHPGVEVGFSHEAENDEAEFLKNTHLAKLHGSVDDPNGIVPPTWNKGLNKEIKPAWRLAYKALAKADHVRIIGYSLSDADAYVKYLLKAAIIDRNRNKSLKSIDVLCREDSEKSVKERYDKLICPTFPNYKFKDGDVKDYLECNLTKCLKTRGGGSFRMNGLEDAHKEFFK